MLLTEDIAGWGDDDGDDSDVPTLEGKTLSLTD